MGFRIEHDEMGPVEVPETALYGAQTRRAHINFAISGLRLQPCFITALALIKKCSARANRDLGLLPFETAAAVMQAADEVIAGKHADQFVIDVFQTGSGTSTNMNMNEVLAGRANELLSGVRGGRSPVHPNDHVNLGQSSNDVIPSALHIAAKGQISTRLLPQLTALQQTLTRKAAEYADIIKPGRTHLQDAVPVTLGQEFGGYAHQVAAGCARTAAAAEELSALALGGTAVGNGINAAPGFARGTIALITAETGLDFHETENHFAAQGAQDATVALSGALKTVAVALMKIANDIRWLSSGPRCGLGELTLPSLQPGSSIMPGKVNPVIPEAVMQAAVQVIGNDCCVTLGGQGGAFELNTMLPLIAYNLLQSIDLLTNAAAVFAEKCLGNLTADRQRCAGLAEQSLGLAACLVPHLGHDRAAAVARAAHADGKTVRQAALDLGVLPRETLVEIFAFLTAAGTASKK